MTRVRLATRGSPLALWQAETVKARLVSVHPDLDVEIVTVKTTGDRDTRHPLGELGVTGIFTKEVDQQILLGHADAAVHSLKDQETVLSDGLAIGMVLERGAVEDVLLTRNGAALPDLPAGARVATGSLRRRAQLLRLRPDLEIVGIRGNVHGRIEKLDGGGAEGIIMARAGIVRLGLESRISAVFTTDEMLPAPSQGIVAVTCRTDDDRTQAVLAACDHPATHAAALAERALLRRLRGGCNVPVGALATAGAEASLHLVARVLSHDGQVVIQHRAEGDRGGAEDLGVALGERLLDDGAEALIAECRP